MVQKNVHIQHPLNEKTTNPEEKQAYHMKLTLVVNLETSDRFWIRIIVPKRGAKLLRQVEE